MNLQTAEAVNEAVQNALRLYHCGALDDSETVALRLIDTDSANATMLNLLGLIASCRQHHEVAVSRFRQAILSNPAVAEFHRNCGDSTRALGHATVALIHYLNALAIDDDYDDVYVSIADLLGLLGKEHAAELSRGIACEIRLRRSSNTWSGRLEDITSSAALADLYHVIGVVSLGGNQLDAACECFKRASSWNPRSAAMRSNLAGALLLTKRDAEAIAVAADAVALDPLFAPAWTNLGKASSRLGQIEQAIVALRRALELTPSGQAAITSWEELGCALLQAGHLSQAIDAFRRLIQLDPERPLGHLNLSIALLKSGELREGWEEFEWRNHPSLQHSYIAAPDIPRWRGEDLRGKSILLQTEHGFGDSLQFIRFAALLNECGARVVVQCEPDLERLFEAIPGISSVYSKEQTPPATDLQIPLLSLPHEFRTRFGMIPNTVPYIAPDPKLQAVWAQRFDNMRRPLVGLTWAGDPAHGEFDKRRSIPFQLLTPLNSLPVTYVSLQKGHGALSSLQTDGTFRIVDPTSEWQDFADGAAIISNLDLVITVDTSVVHLAGALGKSVWLLSRFDGDWRWLENREDSPWYPTLRIFRQPVPGAWDVVIGSVVGELQNLFQV